MVSISTICIAAAQVTIVAAAALHEPRSTLTGKTVYAYGKHIGGLLVYSDTKGLASIATSDYANANGLSNLTWSINTKGTVPWNVSSTSTGSTSVGSFYIDARKSAFSQAGFALNGSVPANHTASNFVLYGSSVMHDSDGSYLSNFWALESGDGSYSLVWNGNGDYRNNSVPVVLKTLAP